MKDKEERWDVDDILKNNKAVFIVKNTTEDRLLYALSVVYKYIQFYNVEDDANYVLLFYAEAEPKNQFFIFTSLPYDRFLRYNPEFLLEE